MKVAILMGSQNDYEVMKAAAETLGALGIEHEVHVKSAHRTPADVARFVEGAAPGGFGVIIAAAGLAAHLAGAVAAHTLLPVIAVPIATGSLGGFDALLASVQMPPGIPVATVAINGAKNAALLAAQILALGDPALGKQLRALRDADADKVRAADAALRR